MPLEKFKLDGKVAIVTGAGKGLGKQMAIALAEAGADIVGTAHSSAAGLEETKAEVAKRGRAFVSVKADLTKKEEIDHVVNQAVKAFERIDIVINNAGTIQRNSVLEFTEQEWDEVIELNSKALFFLSQKSGQLMKAKNIKGNIINIASLRVFQGGTNVVSYSASKGAVASITKSLANELAEFGIRVNAIAPGYMETNITKPYRQNPETNQYILSRTPLGRWGKPEDLDGVVVFLASEASGFITGEIIVVDGGWLIR
ncbi:glucose 1-dehydrogenase [Alkalihalobacillus oceani]|uniref:glucose 1-dehydrogenase n=1 Tax=Halalkalibacter oceani TaxID=1653776 RepID=UPI0020420A78|nr:glucose 1-dehydrogenase [Halalkalibacter oceani]MCM3759902.1 glucose 1-dehydrogenase [Halalkalibacter oceani]